MLLSTILLIVNLSKETVPKIDIPQSPVSSEIKKESLMIIILNDKNRIDRIWTNSAEEPTRIMVRLYTENGDDKPLTDEIKVQYYYLQKQNKIKRNATGFVYPKY